ncbi:hypothetical protein ACLX1H_004515 [Fusarium chlamydosporum]
MDSIIKRLETTRLEDHPRVVWIDTVSAISKLVEDLDSLRLPKGAAGLFLDLEGVNLSRHGTVSIMQIYNEADECVYLVDVFTLGHRCFHTAGSNGRTFKDILEDDHIIKVFFDVRSNSDALFEHFDICLENIRDIQLMELATRTFAKDFVNSLRRCIARDAPLGDYERMAFLYIKDRGRALFVPEEGGSYEAFNQRPLSEVIKTYCARDVQILPRLYRYYDEKVTYKWEKGVLEATEERLEMSQDPEFDGEGRHMTQAPDSWFSRGYIDSC